MTPSKKLQERIQQSRPFRSASQEGLLAILRTANLLRRELASVVEPHGLTGQQYNVLRILRGSHPDGLPTLAVAERMVERTPAITGLIDRLERKGLVSRRRASDDRRRVICEITEAGLALLSDLDPAVDELDDTALAALPVNDQETLVRLLELVIADLDA